MFCNIRNEFIRNKKSVFSWKVFDWCNLQTISCCRPFKRAKEIQKTIQPCRKNYRQVLGILPSFAHNVNDRKTLAEILLLRCDNHKIIQTSQSFRRISFIVLWHAKQTANKVDEWLAPSLLTNIASYSMMSAYIVFFWLLNLFAWM